MFQVTWKIKQLIIGFAVSGIILVILVKCFGYSTQTHSKTSQTVLQNSIRDDWFSDAEEKVHELESKLLSLESRIPKTYPEVKFLNYVQRKRILVTGGAGFVGSHLVDRLMMQGHEVIVADNFFTGRKRNIEHWIGHENFEMIHHDIVNPLFIEVNEIYHLASPASPPHYMYNPVKTIKTNTLGTINMLGNSPIVTHYTRKYTYRNRKRFLELLGATDWRDLFDSHDVDGVVDVFYKKILAAFNGAFPLRHQYATKEKKGWITEGVRKSCRTKRELLMLKRISNDVTLQEYVKKYCRILKQTVVVAKRLHFNRILEKSDNRVKTAWNIVKQETGKNTKKNNTNIIINHDNEVISDSYRVSELFNSFFCNIANHLTDNLPVSGNPRIYLKNVSRSFCSSFFVHPTTGSEIAQVVREMKNKTSCGWDEIPITEIKHSIDLIKEPLAHIFNTSFLYGIFPSKFKLALVKPLYKKGDKTLLANYRPISLLPTFSKILEKIMCNRLTKYIITNKIVNCDQHGFQRDKSTVSAISDFLDSVVSPLDNGEGVLGIFCDLSKAFDCVDHHYLLTKLEFYGIRGVAHSWFASYLDKRKQMVEVWGRGYSSSTEKFCSSVQVVQRGVPQGSILGPILFLLYTNDIVSSINHCKFTLFADDTSIIIKSPDKERLLCKASEVLSDIQRWFFANKLVLNCEKTNSLLFLTPRGTAETLTVSTSYGDILSVEEVGFLGLNIDCHLQWSSHIRKLNSLARRVNAKILIASTSEVYGDPDIHPQPETYWGHVNPIGPRACYDEGKRVSETLTYAYAKQENMQVRVARIFNTYGPRMHMNDGRVVSNFILQALKEEVITVYGSGDQTRSFQYIDDLVEGLVALMNSNYSQPINLGNPVEHSINEFATIIKNLVGGNSKIVHQAEVEDDPQRRRPDISRAKKYLNWEPKVSLQEGLQKTVDYFRKELKRFYYAHRSKLKSGV